MASAVISASTCWGRDSNLTLCVKPLLLHSFTLWTNLPPRPHHSPLLAQEMSQAGIIKAWDSLAVASHRRSPYPGLGEHHYKPVCIPVGTIKRKTRLIKKQRVCSSRSWHPLISSTCSPLISTDSGEMDRCVAWMRFTHSGILFSIASSIVPAKWNFGKSQIV